MERKGETGKYEEGRGGEGEEGMRALITSTTEGERRGGRG